MPHNPLPDDDDALTMSIDPVRDLRGTRVLVIHPVDDELDDLVRHLKRVGCQVGVAWPPPSVLPPDVDVVFFAISLPGHPVVLPKAAEAEPALIAIVDYENPVALKHLLDGNAHSFISKPIRASGIVSSLVMARSLHGYQNRLLAKVAKLEETLRSRREIERATRILMEAKGLSEERAYQLIRGQATAQRLAIGVVARSIITAHRVFDSAEDERVEPARDQTAPGVLRLPARKTS